MRTIHLPNLELNGFMFIRESTLASNMLDQGVLGLALFQNTVSQKRTSIKILSQLRDYTNKSTTHNAIKRIMSLVVLLRDKTIVRVPINIHKFIRLNSIQNNTTVLAESARTFWLITEFKLTRYTTNPITAIDQPQIGYWDPDSIHLVCVSNSNASTTRRWQSLAHERNTVRTNNRHTRLLLSRHFNRNTRLLLSSEQ